MTKFYAQEKRVFDINKVTVIGSPTITSDGVASGFSGSNYLTSSFILGEKDWVIRTKIKTNSTIPSSAVIINGSSCTLQFYNSAIYGSTRDSNNSFILNTPFTPTINTEYLLEFSHIDNLYSFKYSKDNGLTWVLVGSANNTSLSRNVNTQQTYTIGQNFNGEIDLKYCKVYSNNELVYSPTKPVYSLERRKEGFDLSKFTVVGSPTITEAGVASGFSGTNAIRTPEILWGNSLKASIRFNLSSLPHYACLIGGTATKENSIRLTVNPNGELRLSVSDDGSMNYTVVKNLTCPAGTISLNNWYDVDVLFDGFSYKIYVNGSLLAEKTVDKLPYNSSLQLGSERSDANYGQVQGLIDLSHFSITVDGKEVFTGAKEKFYAMRGM